MFAHVCRAHRTAQLHSDMLLLLSFLLVVPELHAGSSQANHPLILVPGLTGSPLEVKMQKVHMPHFFCKGDTHDTWMKVWVDPLQMLPEEIDCTLKRLTLTYDAESDSYSNLPGVEIRALGWANGTREGATSIDKMYTYEFGTMMSHLTEKLSYELGRDMFVAPYDWRLAGDAHSHVTNGVGGLYGQLKQLVEEAVARQGRKAVVLSHSLGCPTMLYFFHNYVTESWREEYIHGWVALSGPWMGGATQVSAYLGGWTLGLPKWLLPHDYVTCRWRPRLPETTLQQTCPSSSPRSAGRLVEARRCPCSANCAILSEKSSDHLRRFQSTTGTPTVFLRQNAMCMTRRSLKALTRQLQRRSLVKEMAS
eukprot:TRINITY_DN27223_c0_g1_i2.p1 TRINITY_DN27223_c0_g1~~TRINITY_DN27223_c0_g1_i2.p1  ORF type:complete len:365 (+),score=48.34 TRINITY_DN27223_c0_g1_i2:38-1132(+)